MSPLRVRVDNHSRLICPKALFYLCRPLHESLSGMAFQGLLRRVWCRPFGVKLVGFSGIWGFTGFKSSGSGCSTLKVED